MNTYSHEIIVPNRDLPFRMFLFEGMNGHYVREMHWHREIEIFAVFAGYLEFRIGDREYHLDEGKCILVNSNEVHSITAPVRNLTLVVQFPMNLVSSHSYSEGGIYFDSFERLNSAGLLPIYKEMYRTYQSPTEGYDLKVLSLFYESLYLLTVHCQLPDVEARMTIHRNLNQLSRITDYLQEHYAEELPLNEVAEMFRYSPTYISHMFQSYAHITYRNYLQNIRLEHAYQMLQDETLNIGEIAEKNGFASSRAFSDAFRKKYGILPGEFRRRLQDDKFLP